ncbi:MAG: hypothetical protein QXY45_01485, partial [Candidatus Aenigmatarchaeota archaeon]
DYSNNGKYKYHRKGLLDEIKHVKLCPGVIIILNEDFRKVAEFMKEYRIIYHVRTVELTGSDEESLTK